MDIASVRKAERNGCNIQLLFIEILMIMLLVSGSWRAASSFSWVKTTCSHVLDFGSAVSRALLLMGGVGSLRPLVTAGDAAHCWRQHGQHA